MSIRDIFRMILAEAPADATEVTIWTDCEGCEHCISLDYCRQLATGNLRLLPVDPTPEMMAEINLTGTFTPSALTVRYHAMINAWEDSNE